MQDIFVPQSRSADALVQQLHTVTYVTSDKTAVERILTGPYGLTGSAWETPKAEMAAYLGFDSDHTVEMATFVKEGDAANIQVRVVAVAQKTPEIRPEYSGLYTGGATLSFPMKDLRAHEAQMNAIGVESTIGVKEMDFTSPAGETYTSAEIVYKAPDHAFLMGVTRPDIFVPTGPIDAQTGVGGPSYSARCLGKAQATMEFFRDVLGFEIRRDTVFEVGERSALNMPQGTKERFIQGFAPGSQTGYVVLMDHHEHTIASTAPGFGPPNRGLVMWSFCTSKFAEVIEQARRAGVRFLQEPGLRNTMGLQQARCAILVDPDGFPIEIAADN